MGKPPRTKDKTMLCNTMEQQVALIDSSQGMEPDLLAYYRFEAASNLCCLPNSCFLVALIDSSGKSLPVT